MPYYREEKTHWLVLMEITNCPFWLLINYLLDSILKLILMGSMPRFPAQIQLKYQDVIMGKAQQYLT